MARYTKRGERLNKGDLAILSHLRRDARKSLVDVAAETGIPVSTVYDRVRRYEGGVIKKHTCLLDFQKLGFNIRLWIFAKVRGEQSLKQLVELLNRHKNINSAFKLSESRCFVMDCIFMNMSELDDFLDQLDSCAIEERKMHFVSEEIANERFLEIEGKMQ